MRGASFGWTIVGPDGSHNRALPKQGTNRYRARLVTVIFKDLGLVDYLSAWDVQRDVHESVVAGGDDTVLLLEHPPVYTAGKRTAPHERPADGTPVIDVDRGGKITFHGPGQLVGYPIVKLPEHVLVVDYVRRLEEALIHTCTDLGVTTARVPGRSGVWLRAEPSNATGQGPRPERKIAAIGIRVSRGVTMHGFALNCDVDLSWYDRFVPCGIADAGVTSLSQELGRDVSVEEVLPVVEGHLRELLGWAPYDPTPDYEPRPEPGRTPPRRPGDNPADTLSVPVLNPLA
jgi:lipoyl(octanoyl) transferase